jgi:signal transduction histidine kinase
VNSLGGRYAVSWPVIGLYAIPSSWIVVLFDQSRLGGDPVRWALLALVSYAATIPILFLARLTILPVRARSPRPITALIVYIVAAYTRSLVSVPLAAAWGLVPASEMQYRFLSTPLNVVFWMVLITLLVTESLEHQDRVLALSGERARLRDAETSVVGASDRYRNGLQARTMNELEPSLKQLVQAWKSSVGERSAAAALSQLHARVDEVLQSLRSTYGELDLGPLPEPTPPPRRVRRGLRSANPVAVGALFAPTLVSAVVLYSAFVPTLALLGWQTTFFLVVPAVIFVWGGALGARSLTGNLRLRLLPASVLTLCVYAFLGLISWPFQLIGSPQASWGLQLEFTVTVVAVAALSIVYRVVQQEREHVEEQLGLVNDALERVVAHLRQTLWVERRKVATVLHGPVQAAVQVAAMRLAKTENNDPGFLDSIQAGIFHALQQIGHPDTVTSEQFQEAVGAMEELWGAVCLLDITVDPAFLRQLPEQGAAARCALEVLREALLNALKHGKADVISAELILTDDHCLQICVTNNGEKPDAERGAGFGTEILDEITRSWSLRTVNDRVMFSSTIVLC